MAGMHLFSELTPDMLESVSGGMSDGLANAILKDMASYKEQGLALEDYLAFYAKTSDEDFALCHTSRQEVEDLIRANW